MRFKRLILILISGLLFAGQGNATTALELAKNGSMKAGRNEFEAARADLTRAIEMSPKVAQFYVNRGYVNYHLNHLLQALRDYDKAVALAPKNAVARNNRGCVYVAMGEPELAAREFHRAIKLAPGYAVPYFNGANLLLNQGATQEAMDGYDKSVELSPKESRAYLNRGVAFLVQDRLQKAEADFSTAVELTPDLFPAYSNRGVARLKLGKTDLAIKDHDKALELNPEADQAYIRRGWAAAEGGDCCWERLKDGVVIRPVFFLDLAEIKKAPAKVVKKRKPDPAYIPIETECDGGAAYLARGIEYFKKGRFDTALMDINNALLMNPGYGIAFRYRGMIYQKRGDAAQAQRDFAAAEVLGEALEPDTSCCEEEIHHIVPCPSCP